MNHAVGLKIDPRRSEPIYRQIFDQIVERISARTFPAGYKLPPTRTLAEALSTHRNTVARAYGDLEAAGFVLSSVGRGTFVAPERPVVDPTKRVPPAATKAWTTLLSRGARADELTRAERFVRPVEGRDVINLARMQPSLDLLPDDLMRRCIDHVLVEHGPRAMTYAPPEGIKALREQIAADLSQSGVPTAAGDVLVTSGSQQAIDLIARALINPGDAILVDRTTYSGAIDLFSLAGARLIAVPNDGQGPDMAALQRLARSDVKALYLMPTGHNPTGLTIGTDRRHELIAWSYASGIPLIEDDYGAGLSLDHAESPPHLRALDGDVVYLSTFSKKLIPALRIGFVVCPAALRPILGSLKRVMDLGTSAILQCALAEFMERGYLRAHMKRVLPEYRARRDALEAALRKALPAEIRWHRPSHGLVLWLRLPPLLDSTQVFEEALKAGVLLSPSALWSVDAGGEQGIRLSFCAEPSERLVEGARRLGKVLKTLVTPASRKDHAGRPVLNMEVV